MAELTITGNGGRKITLPTGLFIDNKFTPAAQNKTVEIENPSTATPIGLVSAAQSSDVDLAVSSAKKASVVWKSTPPQERRRLLNRLADLIEQNAQDFASIEAVDAGMLYNMSLGMSVTQAVETCRYFAGWSDKLDGQSIEYDSGLAYTKREPIGICAAVVPWNSPLMITSWKLAPCLAAGNTLILKTPELAPLYGQKLAQCIAEAGFPPGVVNILCGLGTVAGQALADHNEVRKISFTGSTGVGRTILASAAKSNLKRVTLELGGKGPSIIFSDADWENALMWATMGITVHNGQICAAGSRIYVQEEIYDRFVAEFSKRTKDAVMGDPLLDSTTKGPVISSTQKERIMGFISKANSEGTQVLHGGSEKAESKGHFIPNTAYFNVSPDASIIREEVFGPVASIAKFKTEEEVIALANDNVYGLASSVFTNDISRAIRVSDGIEAGLVCVNSWGSISANTPFGGVKQSGFGRENGEDALHDWTQVKSVKVNILKGKL
ncbi:putative aldehyde dehydrogenase [Fusarium austroafricanum]|uniref:aldehyde dehydrogenase (NAD(+)) n=1 Tax=Fusarium austroafricanum TaxID=2364996 RepID=A0A8H4JXQ3_9HYPO|nr:putative aldehyde dehydrogenase [Fusarium austroafricanum]